MQHDVADPGGVHGLLRGALRVRVRGGGSAGQGGGRQADRHGEGGVGGADGGCDSRGGSGDAEGGCESRKSGSGRGGSGEEEAAGVAESCARSSVPAFEDDRGRSAYAPEDEDAALGEAGGEEAAVEGLEPAKSSCCWQFCVLVAW